MNKLDLLYGALIGMLGAFVGVFLFILLATDHTFVYGITTLLNSGSINKIIALGEILNVPIFYWLLNKNQYIKAKGILLQAILLTIVSLFI